MVGSQDIFLLYTAILVAFLMKFMNNCCRISVPYPFQWGAPTFDAGEAFAMMMTSFIVLVEVCLQFSLKMEEKLY